MSTAPSLDALMHRFADQLDEHPPETWTPELLRAMIALFDLHMQNNSYTATVALVRS